MESAIFEQRLIMKTKLLYTYGALLALTAIAALIIIGMKTRNLMISSLLFSLGSIIVAKNLNKDQVAISVAGYLLPFAAFLLFAYRSAINLLALIGIVQHELDQYDAYNKCLNLIFLIFMASGSLTVALIMFAQNNKNNN